MKQSTNGSNDYNVSYSIIEFFERALRDHKTVQSFERNNDICFKIQTTKNITIRACLVNEYILGIACVQKIRSEFPEIEYIVTGGVWNGYTKEAKDYGSKNRIGIFVVDEFFGALRRKDPKSYIKKDKDGNPVFKYRG